MPLAQNDSICVIGDIPAPGSEGGSRRIFLERTGSSSKGKHEIWSTIEQIIVPRNSAISYRWVAACYHYECC